MPFSSGTFSRVHDWTTDRDAGIKISASRTDAEFDGIATGLTTCILKDGTQTLTAMIPFTLGLSLPTDKKLQIRDSAIYINSSGDGQLDLVADTEIELTAPTVDVAASTAVTIATPSLIITDNTTDEPIVQIKNTHNGTTAGELRFVMDKGSAGADGDDLGTISFYGDDSGQNQTAFAKIVGEVSESADTDEAGKLSFFVAESDGTNTALTAGLVLEGEHATDGEVDVTIGAGAASTTAVTGNLTVGGTSTFTGAVTGTTMTHLVTLTADNDTDITFSSTYITDSYMDYKVIIRFYAPSSNAQTLFVSPSGDNGSNYNILIEEHMQYHDMKAGQSFGMASTANNLQKIQLGSGTENTANKGMSAELMFIGLRQTTGFKMMHFNCLGAHDLDTGHGNITADGGGGGSDYWWQGGAKIIGTSDSNRVAINNLKFTASSGNIKQGTFSLYGIKS